MRRITRGDYPAGENAIDEQFANAQLRLTRLIVVPGKPMPLPARPGPGLLITIPSGDTRWIHAKTATTLSDLGEYLRVGFLTAPSR